jgi:hypothetical protein
MPSLLALATLGEMTLIEKILFVESGQGKCGWFNPDMIPLLVSPGNTEGGSITVPLTSCLTGLE